MLSEPRKCVLWQQQCHEPSPASGQGCCCCSARFGVALGLLPLPGHQDGASCPSLQALADISGLFFTPAQRKDEWSLPCCTESLREMFSQQRKAWNAMSHLTDTLCATSSLLLLGARRAGTICWPHLEHQHSCHFGEWDNTAASIHRAAGDWKQDAMLWVIVLLTASCSVWSRICRDFSFSFDFFPFVCLGS